MIVLIVFIIIILAICMGLPALFFHKEIGEWYRNKCVLRMKAKKHFCVDCVHCYKISTGYRTEYICGLDLANHDGVLGRFEYRHGAESSYGGKYCKWERAADTQDVVEDESD